RSTSSTTTRSTDGKRSSKRSRWRGSTRSISTSGSTLRQNVGVLEIFVRQFAPIPRVKGDDFQARSHHHRFEGGPVVRHRQIRLVRRLDVGPLTLAPKRQKREVRFDLPSRLLIQDKRGEISLGAAFHTAARFPEIVCNLGGRHVREDRGGAYEIGRGIGNRESIA